jgi:enolase
MVNHYDTPDEVFEIVHTITSNLRKYIVSLKGGEVNLKYYVDGTYMCTADLILDNLKIIEEAINKTNYKDKVGIGMSMMADNLYHPDQKKYELENPKLLLDTDAMVILVYFILD